ncbi:hypothetical protein PF001_g27187 [Phytophthora fragariae]|uniref:Secreted protein n=1 Tax=Phytophthora fragariae TaxID=53985 RepID=A0A6A4BN21_9STRA|nr:hypothetical protein PF001_g27187 [Phytophthora fragariae]
MIGAVFPVLMWCSTFTFASSGHPGFFTTMPAYCRSNAITRSLSAASMSPISSLSSSWRGRATSFFRASTHFATRSLSSSPLSDKICMSASVGIHVPSASRAGSFSRRPSTFNTTTLTFPSLTVSMVGAISRCRFEVGLGKNTPVVPSSASTFICTTLLVYVANLTVFAKRTTALRSCPACCRVDTP